MALLQAGRKFIEMFATGRMSYLGDARSFGNLRAVFSDGPEGGRNFETLYSYNAPIARRWRGGNIAWVTSRTFSKTTTHHTREALRKLRSSPLIERVVQTPTEPEAMEGLLVMEDAALEKGQ